MRGESRRRFSDMLIAAAEYRDVARLKRASFPVLVPCDRPALRLTKDLAYPRGERAVLLLDLALQPPDHERRAREASFDAARPCESVVLLWQAHCGESRAKGRVGEAHDALAAAPGFGQRLLWTVVRSAHDVERGLRQRAVGVAEAVDRLFGVADPSALLDHACQRHEDREL